MHGLLYSNITSLELAESLDGGAVALPNQVAGAGLGLKLRLAEKLEGTSVESRRTVHSLKASLGLADARPERGRFKLKIGAGAESAGVNTTEAIEYNTTASQLGEKIDALTGIPTLVPCMVEFGDGAWRVRFADASAPVTITCVESTLWPVSFVNAEAVAFDEGYTHEIRLVQTPVAQTSTFGLIVPAAPFVTGIVDGGVNGDIEWNEVQKITIPAEFRGAFQVKRGFRRTKPIGLPVDSDQMAEALELIADEDGTFTLTEEQGAVLVEFGGSMEATDHDLLEIVVFDPPPGDLLVRLDTDTAEMRAIMRKANRDGEVKLLLEIVMELEREDDDEQYEKVIFRTEVTFVAPVNWEAQSVAASLDWNQPPARRRYIPFSPDQVVVGQKHYFAAIGDGVALSFTINHNLGTANLHVTVKENSEGGLRIFDNTYDVEYDDDNAITLTFGSEPTLNGLVVLITTADQDAAFLAHTHAIGEITGLQEQLTALSEALAELQARAGTSGLTVESRTSGSAVIAELTLPTLLEIFPTRGTIVVPQGGAAPESLAGVTDAMLPRAGGLLPAVHDATVETLVEPLGSTESLENKVFTYEGATYVDLPGSFGVKTVRLKPGQHAAVLVQDDRVSWYRVARVLEGETSWYPTAFNRDLFEIAVNDSQLRRKKALTVLLGIELALFKTNTRAVWTLVIEHGVDSKATTPEGTGITFTAATDDTLTAAAHGLQDGAPVKVSSAGTLPAGLTAGTTYYVRDATTNTFKLALTPGAAAVDITSTGSGTHTLKGQTGANLSGITWDPVPIVEQLIQLSPVPCTHILGCRIERANDDAITAVQLKYGAEIEGGSKPASGTFRLRGRLVRFDTEDSEEDPRGLVGVMGLARVIGEGTADESSDIGKAIIK